MRFVPLIDFDHSIDQSPTEEESELIGGVVVSYQREPKEEEQEKRRTEEQEKRRTEEQEKRRSR